VAKILFNEDGSVKWGKEVLQNKITEPKVWVLRALKELPFPVGRKLLIEILQGNEENKVIKRNKFQRLVCFASLIYSQKELDEIVKELIEKEYIKSVSFNTNSFWKVLKITLKGKRALEDPQHFIEKKVIKIKTIITAEDEIVFKNFDFFLEPFNKEQKKAIISPKKTVLCIAGAGSGKTTVLTKKIEFLLKFKGVSSNKILAITFTRKAREEMQKRLAELGHRDVRVETFNSFCEKILRKHDTLIYDKPMRMMAYKDKIKVFTDAIASSGISVHGAIDVFFTRAQLRSKTDDQLFRIFLNDCYFIVDYHKAKGKELEDFSLVAKDPARAKMTYKICKYISKSMRDRGFRDHTDQIVDALNFLKENSKYLPLFEYVLVDEYQDVNDLQIELIDTLNSTNLFCVGDPRQSIFGWRGSNISYIKNFKKKYPESEQISLTKNYRSTKAIVNLMNESIKKMKYEDLEFVKEGKKDIKLLHFDDEQSEQGFVFQSILAAKVPKQEIFVLARTNRQLNEFSKLLTQNNVPHIVKSDENKVVDVKEGQVTLATVHAIKGLEAKQVYVIGCNYLNFPCRANEHPVIELIKVEEYDKDEEERRLFYVALSRAKETLCLTYSGRKHTSYITDSMKKHYLEYVSLNGMLKNY
jgi:superfamily I DNA/RNA helicase